MLRHAADVAKLQLRLGGEVHWEHPRHALSWREHLPLVGSFGFEWKHPDGSIYKDIVMELLRAMDVVMTLADALEPWTPSGRR